MISTPRPSEVRLKSKLSVLYRDAAPVNYTPQAGSPKPFSHTSCYTDTQIQLVQCPSAKLGNPLYYYNVTSTFPLVILHFPRQGDISESLRTIQIHHPTVTKFIFVQIAKSEVVYIDGEPYQRNPVNPVLNAGNSVPLNYCTFPNTEYPGGIDLISYQSESIANYLKGMYTNTIHPSYEVYQRSITSGSVETMNIPHNLHLSTVSMPYIQKLQELCLSSGLQSITNRTTAVVFISFEHQSYVNSWAMLPLLWMYATRKIERVFGMTESYKSSVKLNESVPNLKHLSLYELETMHLQFLNKQHKRHNQRQLIIDQCEYPAFKEKLIKFHANRTRAHNAQYYSYFNLISSTTHSAVLMIQHTYRRYAQHKARAKYASAIKPSIVTINGVTLSNQRIYIPLHSSISKNNDNLIDTFVIQPNSCPAIDLILTKLVSHFPLLFTQGISTTIQKKISKYYPTYMVHTKPVYMDRAQSSDQLGHVNREDTDQMSFEQNSEDEEISVFWHTIDNLNVKNGIDQSSNGNSMEGYPDTMDSTNTCKVNPLSIISICFKYLDENRLEYIQDLLVNYSEHLGYQHKLATYIEEVIFLLYYLAYIFHIINNNTSPLDSVPNIMSMSTLISAMHTIKEHNVKLDSDSNCGSMQYSFEQWIDFYCPYEIKSLLFNDQALYCLMKEYPELYNSLSSVIELSKHLSHSTISYHMPELDTLVEISPPDPPQVKLPDKVHSIVDQHMYKLDPDIPIYIYSNMYSLPIIAKDVQTVIKSIQSSHFHPNQVYLFNHTAEHSTVDSMRYRYDEGKINRVSLSWLWITPQPVLFIYNKPYYPQYLSRRLRSTIKYNSIKYDGSYISNLTRVPKVQLKPNPSSTNNSMDRSIKDKSPGLKPLNSMQTHYTHQAIDNELERNATQLKHTVYRLNDKVLYKCPSILPNEISKASMLFTTINGNKSMGITNSIIPQIQQSWESIIAAHLSNYLVSSNGVVRVVDMHYDTSYFYNYMCIEYINALTSLKENTVNTGTTNSNSDPVATNGYSTLTSLNRPLQACKTISFKFDNAVQSLSDHISINYSIYELNVLTFARSTIIPLKLKAVDLERHIKCAKQIITGKKNSVNPVESNIIQDMNNQVTATNQSDLKRINNTNCSYSKNTISNSTSCNEKSVIQTHNSFKSRNILYTPDTKVTESHSKYIQSNPNYLKDGHVIQTLEEINSALSNYFVDSATFNFHRIQSKSSNRSHMKELAVFIHYVESLFVPVISVSLEDNTNLPNTSSYSRLSNTKHGLSLKDDKCHTNMQRQLNTGYKNTAQTELFYSNTNLANKCSDSRGNRSKIKYDYLCLTTAPSSTFIRPSVIAAPFYYTLNPTHLDLTSINAEPIESTEDSTNLFYLAIFSVIICSYTYTYKEMQSRLRKFLYNAPSENTRPTDIQDHRNSNLLFNLSELIKSRSASSISTSNIDVKTSNDLPTDSALFTKHQPIESITYFAYIYNPIKYITETCYVYNLLISDTYSVFHLNVVQQLVTFFPATIPAVIFYQEYMIKRNNQSHLLLIYAINAVKYAESLSKADQSGSIFPENQTSYSMLKIRQAVAKAVCYCEQVILAILTHLFLLYGVSIYNHFPIHFLNAKYPESIQSSGTPGPSFHSSLSALIDANSQTDSVLFADYFSNETLLHYCEPMLISNDPQTREYINNFESSYPEHIPLLRVILSMFPSTNTPLLKLFIPSQTLSVSSSILDIEYFLKQCKPLHHWLAHLDPWAQSTQIYSSYYWDQIESNTVPHIIFNTGSTMGQSPDYLHGLYTHISSRYHV